MSLTSHNEAGTTEGKEHHRMRLVLQNKDRLTEKPVSQKGKMKSCFIAK